MDFKRLLRNRGGSVTSTILVVGMLIVTIGVISASQLLTKKQVDVQTRAAGSIKVAAPVAGNIITDAASPNYGCRYAKGEWCLWNSSNASAVVTDSGQLRLTAKNMAANTGACWIQRLNIDQVSPRRYTVALNLERPRAPTLGQIFMATEIRDNANFHTQQITGTGAMNYVIDIPNTTDFASIKLCLWAANFTEPTSITLSTISVTQSLIPQTNVQPSVAPITCNISMQNPPQIGGKVYSITGNPQGGNGNYTYSWRVVQGSNNSITYGNLSANNTKSVSWTAPTNTSLGTIGIARLDVRDTAGTTGTCQLGVQVYQPTPTTAALATNHAIDGYIRYSNGVGTAGVMVKLYAYNSALTTRTVKTQLTTDSNGYYKFTNIPSGTYDVEPQSTTAIKINPAMQTMVLINSMQDVTTPLFTASGSPTATPVINKVICTTNADCGCGVDISQTNTNSCVIQNKQYLSAKFKCTAPDFCSGVTGTCTPQCISGRCQKVCPAVATATPIPTKTLTPIPPTATRTPTNTIVPPTASPTNPPYCYLRSKGDADCNDRIEILDFVCWMNKYVNNRQDAQCIYTDFDGVNGTNLVDFAIWKLNN